MTEQHRDGKTLDEIKFFLQIGSMPEKNDVLPGLDIDVTKRMSSFLYYGDIVMNYVDNQLKNGEDILTNYQL
jgi:hypothetical protein